LNCKMKGE